MSQEQGTVAADLAAGAMAGAVGTLAMGEVTTFMYARENRLARWQENYQRGWESADEIAASRMADAFGASLDRHETQSLGTAVHYGLGAGSASLYGAVRKHIPGPSFLKGLGFGSAVWLVADEGMNPALGITPGPRAFPWQTHARGLVAHLVYGLVTEGMLALADRVRKD